MNMSEQLIGKKLTHFETIDSTNSFILRNIETLPHGFVAYSSNQTCAHGSKGRKWVEFKDKSIGISILFKQVDSQFLCASTKLGCVCVRKTLCDFGVENVKIKWFNDIIISNKKVAGVLGESQICGRTTHLALGVGLNLLQQISDFEEHGLFYAGSIFSQTGKIIKLNEFFEKFLYNLNELYFNFQNEPSQTIKTINETYFKNCLTIGIKLKVVDNFTQSSFNAMSKDILQNGNLLVETADKKLLELTPEQFSVFPLD